MSTGGCHLVAFRFRWFIFMDAQDLQDFEREGFLDSGFRRNDGVVWE